VAYWVWSVWAVSGVAALIDGEDLELVVLGVGW
jgi:hypothetical protein